MKIFLDTANVTQLRMPKSEEHQMSAQRHVTDRDKHTGYAPRTIAPWPAKGEAKHAEPGHQGCGAASARELLRRKEHARDAHETEEVAKRAYHFWEERGRPLGSPEVDWSRAEQEEGIAKLAYRFWEERGRPLGSPEVDWSRGEPEFENRRHVMPPLLGIALGPGWLE